MKQLRWGMYGMAIQAFTTWILSQTGLLVVTPLQQATVSVLYMALTVLLAIAEKRGT